MTDETSGARAPEKTALHDEHVAAGGRMVEFAGWMMPVQYSGIVEEHNRVREAAGLFDVSHMGEVWITGPTAARRRSAARSAISERIMKPSFACGWKTLPIPSCPSVSNFNRARFCGSFSKPCLSDTKSQIRRLNCSDRVDG